MKSLKIKLAASAAAVIVAMAALPFVGITRTAEDTREGLVLDFGYWETEWIDMRFSGGMDGNDVLDAACAERGYAVTRLDDGSLYSVNGQENLIGIRWGFYVLGGGGWEEGDPASADVSAYRLVSWARASGPGDLIPGTDYQGFGYYSYADGGVSLSTGEGLRIVTLAPSLTETVTALGGMEYIVGTDLYSNYPQAISDRQRSGEIKYVGGYIDPNYEWILKVSPDVVFCDGGVGQHVSMADKLRKAGIGCVVLYDAVDVAAMYDNIWIVASAMGLSGNAKGLIGSLRDSMSISAGIAGETNKRVFAALSADPSPWTAGSHTFMSDIISNAGGKNIFDSQSSSWFMVSKEQIYAKQPQVILVLSSVPVDSEDDYRRVLDGLDPMWKSTPAYESGDVYVFCGQATDVLERPGPRLAEAAELVAKILNPEAFSLKDPLDAVPKYIGDDYRYYLRYTEDVFP